MGRTKKARGTVEDICGKLSDRCHVSRGEAREELLPLIRFIVSRDVRSARRIADDLDLEDEEVEYLAGDLAEEVLEGPDEEPLVVEEEEPQSSLMDF